MAISPDKQDITITVNVTEGERFVVAGVKLEGNYLEREDEFKSLVSIRAGEPYNADQVSQNHQGVFGPLRPFWVCIFACRGGAGN